MRFNSYIFVILFVPIVVLGYFYLNHKEKYRTAQIYLLISSLIFYSYAGIPYFILLLISIAGNYIFSFLMNKAGKIWMIAGIIFNVAILFYFKYYDFFISGLNTLMKSDFALKNVLLPLGISFYTFQQISYIIDRGTGKAKHYSLLDYMSFVTFFPQLVAGPIVKHEELIPQFHDESRKKMSWENIYKGICLFVLGLSKKTLIADYLSLAVDYGYENVSILDTPGAFFVILGFTLQLYFDFSGYSDMALGLGKMLNLDLPMNFDRPYRSKSISEFWRRWHITLNRFLTEYIYIPCGGNKKGQIRKILNIMIVFLISGLWHGANWTFVIWGGIQGVFVAAESIFLRKKKINKWIGFLYCFSIENLLWVIFRSTTFQQAISIYQRLFSFTWNGSIAKISFAMDNSILFIPKQLIKRIGLASVYEYIFPAYMFIVFGVSVYLLTTKNPYQRVIETKSKMPNPRIIAVLFICCIMCFSNTEVFLYSNF